MTVAPVPQVDSPAFARAARRGLVLLTLINLVNYIDRFILPTLLGSIKRDLGLDDRHLGYVGSAFLIVYTLTSPVFGWLGDTRSRPRLIAIGIAIWSVATVLGGFAMGFLSLFLARATVGVGEAAYATIAPPLVADYYGKQKRGKVLGIFFMAIPVGAALGYVLGGQMDVHFGWRSAFFVAGVPGLVLALLSLKLFDPPRGINDGESAAAHASGLPRSTRERLRAFRGLLSNRPYVFATAGYAAWTFAVGGLAHWMPEFLRRVRGMDEGKATVQFGAVVVGTGIVGTLVGGWLADRLLARSRHAHFWLSGVATLLAAPVLFVALTTTSDALYMVAIIVGELLIFSSTSPINSALVNTVDPRQRATAAALAIFAIHFLGDVPSPTLIGVVSDSNSLAEAVLVVPLAVLVAGAIWTYAAWSGGRRDAATGAA